MPRSSTPSLPGMTGTLQPWSDDFVDDFVSSATGTVTAREITNAANLSVPLVFAPAALDAALMKTVGKRLKALGYGTVSDPATPGGVLYVPAEQMTLALLLDDVTLKHAHIQDSGRSLRRHIEAVVEASTDPALNLLDADTILTMAGIDPLSVAA